MVDSPSLKMSFFFILTFSLSVFGWLWAILGCGGGFLAGGFIFASSGPGSFKYLTLGFPHPPVLSLHIYTRPTGDWNLPHNLSFSAQNLRKRPTFLGQRAVFLILLSLWVGGVSALWRVSVLGPCFIGPKSHLCSHVGNKPYPLGHAVAFGYCSPCRFPYARIT